MKASPFLWWCFLKCFEIRFNNYPKYFDIWTDVDNRIYRQTPDIIDATFCGINYSNSPPFGNTNYNYTKKVEKTLYWFSSSNEAFQYNIQGCTYYWIEIGQITF